MDDQMKSHAPTSCLLPLIIAASAQPRQSLRIRLMLAMMVLVLGELLALQAAQARAESAFTEVSDNSRTATSSISKAEENIRAARIAIAAYPDAEAPVASLIDALVRANRKSE